MKTVSIGSVSYGVMVWRRESMCVNGRMKMHGKLSDVGVKNAYENLEH